MCLFSALTSYSKHLKTTPALSPEQVICNVWKGKKQRVLWSKIGPYKLFTKNMMGLAPQKKLESEIVNAYLHNLASRLQSSGVAAFLIDSYQMSAIWRGSKKGLKKLDPSGYDVLFGAVCDSNHWTFIAMYPKEGKIHLH
ncbi:hypothetical protein Q8A67_007249 [Cirrhinus molitorella]|uniref:Uncharacterized protein n=1 Tax=Cirrhinus molitorella TaxID=172907 RepID=A0AA88Q5R7_9TELE|nr:hypothetical protein Q8A67_007249 [Cirrhinus molitorella]